MAFSDMTDRVLKTVTKTLGKSIEYQPASGSPVTLNGVFSEQFTQEDPGTGLIVSTQQPNVLIRRGDLSADPERDDQVEISGTTYNITDAQEDGEGGILLLLNEA